LPGIHNALRFGRGREGQKITATIYSSAEVEAGRGRGGDISLNLPKKAGKPPILRFSSERKKSRRRKVTEILFNLLSPREKKGGRRKTAFIAPTLIGVDFTQSRKGGGL